MDRQEQFESLFERYHKAVLVFFRNRGFKEEESRDMVQETFMEVFKSLSRFDDEYPRAWILTVARNHWIKRLRSANTLKRSAELVPLEAIEREIKFSSANEDPPIELERLLQEEKRAWLRRELDALPPQMRQCLRLRVDQGMKYREIAAVLQINVQTVKSHLSQAKARLQNALAERSHHQEEVENG